MMTPALQTKNFQNTGFPPAYMSGETKQQDQVALQEEYLPFTVRQVGNQSDLDKAIRLRHQAYARHMPEFAEALKQPESDDKLDGAVILLAESKVDGSAIGTLRIQTNLHAPLNVEQSVTLPAFLSGKRIAEVRRLAVAPGSAGRLVKLILLKAVHMYCKSNRIDWILVAARTPLDRTYEHLTLSDVLDGETFVPLPRANNVPHRLLGAPIDALASRGAAMKHPLYDFFFATRHPDIDPTCHVSLEDKAEMRSHASALLQNPQQPN